MVGACSFVNKDIPPFVLAAGRPCRVRGLNVVGLKRAGLSPAASAPLKAAFRLVYRSSLTLSAALDRIELELLGPALPGQGREQLEELVSFCRSSVRGIELRTGPDREYATEQEDE
jgi:UDP-N-acetylglucosamine acyltransferase